VLPRWSSGRKSGGGEDDRGSHPSTSAESNTSNGPQSFQQGCRTNPARRTHSMSESRGKRHAVQQGKGVPGLMPAGRKVKLQGRKRKRKRSETSMEPRGRWKKEKGEDGVVKRTRKDGSGKRCEGKEDHPQLFGERGQQPKKKRKKKKRGGLPGKKRGGTSSWSRGKREGRASATERRSRSKTSVRNGALAKFEPGEGKPRCPHLRRVLRIRQPTLAKKMLHLSLGWGRLSPSQGHPLFSVCRLRAAVQTRKKPLLPQELKKTSVGPVSNDRGGTSMERGEANHQNGNQTPEGRSRDRRAAAPGEKEKKPKRPRRRSSSSKSGGELVQGKGGRSRAESRCWEAKRNLNKS